MKKIQVKLKGTTPLLMNNPASMLEESEKLKKTTQGNNLKQDAEKLAYRKDNGELYVPAEAIKGSLVNASAYKKIGKYSAKPIISGGVHILPQEIGLGVREYVLDIRTVVIQRKSRVIKARPKIENWTINFEISYDDSMIGDPEIIRAILEEAGKRVGLLDFRPQRMGSFGMFEIALWKQIL